MEKLKQEPAVVIGFLMSLLMAITEVLDAVTMNRPLGVLAVVKAIIPIVAGFLIKTRVLSREWLTLVVTRSREVIKEGESVVDVIAEQIPVAPESRPATDLG